MGDYFYRETKFLRDPFGHDLTVLHHRRTGAEKGNALATSFRNGVKEYGYGCHPAFEIAKCVYRVREPPLLVGSLARMSGYGWAFLRRDPRLLPDDVLKFLRNEQVERLKARFRPS